MNEWKLVSNKKIINININSIFTVNNLNLFNLYTLHKTYNENLILNYGIKGNSYKFKLLKTEIILNLEKYLKKKEKNLNNFKKILLTNCSKPTFKFNIDNIELKSIIYGFKFLQDYDKKFVFLICKLNSTEINYCIISYKLNTFNVNNNLYCIFINNWIEVLLYLFKFEIDIYKNTNKTFILNYPECFLDKKNNIINYFNNFKKIWR